MNRTECNARGNPLSDHPKRQRRLGFNDRGWFWKCLRCGATWPATDLPDEEDVKVLLADDITASVYGDPCV